MNCAYRLIWNEQLNAWVVAPEIASARGKRSRIRRCAATLLLTLAIGSHATLAADLAATALPGGGQISAGQATISSNGAAMTINQGSQRAIINWQNFDIGSQASVNFQQPNTSAVTLNRAGGPTASRIEGQLTANGQVFLINPSGVLFGSGARVNVGGLVASTLNIRDADFLAGNYVFSGSGGSIDNQGKITAAPGGYLAFIAPNITNNGTISAPQGTVAMGAGERVRLNFAGDRLVGLDVSASTIDTLITNNQAIRAEGGAILLTAAGAEAVTRSVINNTGVLEASSLTSDGGRIVLTAGNDINLGAGSAVAVNGQKGGEITVQAQSGTLLADGTLSARGEAGVGGNVKLLGHQVGLVNAARVDASGVTGGGTVLVGGDYQGKSPDVQNAARTYVSADATIKADAVEKGDGGKVVVWADGDSRYNGAISARGGAQGGDGGLVEVSGKQDLDFHGKVDVAAPLGVGGNVLLDPQDIVLNTTTQTPPPNNAIGTPDVAFATPPAPGTYTIEIADVTGFNELFLQATRDITISSPLVMAPSNTIRFEANNNINVNAAITTSVAPSPARPAITLTADADNSGAGTLAIAAALSSGKGGLALSGASVTSTAAGSITSTGIVGASGGDVSITGTSAAGNINLGGAIVSTGGVAAAGTTGRTGGNVTINGAGAVTTAAITASGSAGAGAGLNLAGGNGGAISITGVGGVTTAALAASGGAATTTNGKGGNAGSITLANSGSGNIATTTLTASTGAATGTGAGGTAGSISVTNTAAGGNITTTNISTLGTNNAGGGNVLLSSQGNVTVTGTIGTSAGTNSSLTAGRAAGNITITGVNRTITGLMTANGGIASGTNQAGGGAGIVSVTGTGTLSTVGINSRTGTATGTGAGGTVGGITLSGSNVTTGGLLDTSGRDNGDGGNIGITATGLLTLNGALLSTGGVNVAGTTQAGNNAGNITLSGNGITSTAAATITANGGAGLGTNQAGGNAGQISITGTGTGAIALNTGAAITASTGAATGTGAGGAVGGITLNGPSITSTGALTTTGGANGNGGNVSATTTTGSLRVGAIVASGGTANAGTAGRNAGTVTISSAGGVTTGAITANGTAGNGTNQAGGNAGSIAVTNSGSGNIATTTLTASTGAATGTGAGGTAGSISVTNTAAGGNITTTNISTLGTNNAGGGNVLLSSQGNVTVTGTIGTSAGTNSSLTAGRAAGNITITGVNRTITGLMTANGGIASGTNQAGGGAGIVSVTGTGTLSTVGINSRTGTATGTGAGGTVGGITLSGSNVTTGGLLDTSGRDNGDGGNIGITATGLLTLNGALLSTGGVNVAGTTQAGNNAGNITLSGNGITSTAAATITANGGAGLGTNQAGGNAGQISITGTGTGAIALNTGAAITASTGAATGTGAGGAVGGITLNGPSITSTGALTTTGGANGNGGNVSATTTTGSLRVGAIVASGGTANAGTAGRNAGTVTISSAGGVTTGAITANGTAGNGTNQAGGNAGSIAVTNSGSGNIATTTLTASTGAATGTGAGGTAGSISVTNTAAGGNITTTNISTLGTNNAGGGNVLLSSQGNVTVTGTIGTSAGTNSSLTAGRAAGNITITGVNRTITGLMTANGGIASGTNQAGGGAGIVSVTGTGTLSTVGINSRTGTATGTGAGGTVGGITLSGSNVTTGGLLDTSGRDNGDGGNIGITATGLLTLNGALLSTGGVNVAGTTQAGNNAGNITLSGNGITSTAAATITANGGAGLGTNQAGGNAGQISITGTGTGAIALNTGAAITASTGAATGTGAGGAVGGITLNGPSITSTGALTTTGGANGNGGNVSATTTSGNLSVGAITTTGGAANAGTAGRNAGNVTLNSAGAVTTAVITANGSAGNGTNQAGGNGGNISLDAGGATPLVTIGGNLSALGGDRTGAGFAGAGGNITVADTLNIGAANRTISTRGGSTGVGAGGNITLGGSIYDDGGVRSLTVTGGSGVVTVAGGTANATLANNLDTLVVTASDGAGKIRVGSVKTVAAQSYDAGTGGIELNGDVVTLGSAGADTVTVSDPVTLTGNSSITTAGGSSDNIAINQTVNGAFGLTLNAGASGNVSTSAIIGGSTPLTSFSATGAAVTLGQSVTAGSIFARSTTGNVTLNAPAVLTGTGIGNAIELVAGGAASRFINNAGAGALNASNAAGRFLVWSQNPANDTRGGLAYAFKQYNATYGVTPVAQPTGNGFLYSLAPTITPALTGTVSKAYDATTSAPLVAANFTPTSGVDGDVITMSGTGTYDNANVAGSPTKPVTATGIAATVTSSVADGSKPVYGYTLTSTTASDNIGEITPAPLTITGATGSSVYSAAAQTNTYSSSGLLTGNGDSVTGVSTLASGTNVGTYADNLTSATGSGLANYTIGYVNGSLTITPAPLTITANDAQRPVDTPNPAFSATYSGFLGGETPAVLNGVLAFSTPATLTSPVGIYPITPYGQSSGNYTITYLDGKLTIQGTPVVAPTLPREVVSQQAIGAQYTDPTMPSDVLTGLQFTFEDKHDTKDEKVAASVVRVIGSGIRLPN